MSQLIAPSKRLLYPNFSMELPLRGSTINEQYINERILANNKINNNNINIIKDIRTYYEIKTNEKLGRYKNYFNVAEITEILLSSIATTATSASVALTGI